MQTLVQIHRISCSNKVESSRVLRSEIIAEVTVSILTTGYYLGHTQCCALQSLPRRHYCPILHSTSTYPRMCRAQTRLTTTSWMKRFLDTTVTIHLTLNHCQRLHSIIRLAAACKMYNQCFCYHDVCCNANCSLPCVLLLAVFMDWIVEIFSVCIIFRFTYIFCLSREWNATHYRLIYKRLLLFNSWTVFKVIRTVSNKSNSSVRATRLGWNRQFRWATSYILEFVVLIQWSTSMHCL